MRSDGRWKPRTSDDLGHALDESLPKAREALAGTTDETVKNWRLRVGGPGGNEKPRHIMLCDEVFAHLAHHCGG